MMAKTIALGKLWYCFGAWRTLKKGMNHDIAMWALNVLNTNWATTQVDKAYFWLTPADDGPLRIVRTARLTRKDRCSHCDPPQVSYHYSLDGPQHFPEYTERLLIKAAVPTGNYWIEWRIA